MSGLPAVTALCEGEGKVRSEVLPGFELEVASLA
jgi:hypothetical protein